MGVTAAWVGVGLAATSANMQRIEAKQARRSAESQAALEREALAALQEEPEPVMPLADDAATRRARRRSITGQMRRRGRASTILTDSGAADALGV